MQLPAQHHLRNLSLENPDGTPHTVDETLHPREARRLLCYC